MFWSQECCSACNRTFVHRAALEQHYLNSSRHSWCNRCDEFFESDDALSKHQDSSLSHWICSYCNLDFYDEDDLEKHYQLTSDHDRRIWCERCQIPFADAESIEFHISESEDHWLCDRCNLEYYDREDLFGHFRISNEHNWCETCHRDFDSHHKLRSHMLTHQPHNIPCFGCGNDRMFGTYSAMLIHLESGNCSTSMTELDKIARVCFQSKKFMLHDLYDSLTDNWRLRTQVRGSWDSSRSVWKCSNCIKNFVDKAAVSKHLLSPVHDPLIYQCPGCDLQFSIISGLVQHVESENCNEGVQEGTGSIFKLLRYIHLRVSGVL